MSVLEPPLMHDAGPPMSQTLHSPPPPQSPQQQQHRTLSSPSIVIDHDAASISSHSNRSTSSTPTQSSFPASELGQGRKSRTGPRSSSSSSLTRQRSVGGGSGSIKRNSRLGKQGFGPLLPVLVAPPMADSPSNDEAVSDGQSTPGAAMPGGFGDAASVSGNKSPSQSPPVEGDSAKGGLGISGDGAGDDNTSTTAQSSTLETGDSAPKLSGRLSRYIDPSDNPYAGATGEEVDDENNDNDDDSNTTPGGHARQHSRQKTLDTAPQLLPQPLSPRPMSRERSRSPTKTTPGLSGEVPVPSPPPSTTDRINALNERQIGGADRSATASPPGFTRKASSGFAGLLGRMGSIRRSGKSPPAPQQGPIFVRRNTAASIDSAAGSTLASIADGPEDGEGSSGATKMTLQDQFQNLRKQEEFGIPGANGHYIPPEEGQTGATTSTAAKRKSSGASTTTTTGPPSPTKTRADSTSSIKSPPMNPDLPPGTASGMTAGPAEEPRAVDWDLWQALVMEGPGAVTTSSGKELSQAIASGIPAAIRGVVWQVLAESKNEELEALYQTLKGRSAGEPEQSTLKPSPVSRGGSQSNISLTTTNEETPSAASDTVASSEAPSGAASEATTPPATSTSTFAASPPRSIQGDDPELRSKLLQEKQKREAAALQKLEKAIKRDMGSRTSYSKFTQSAGLQDGLFGVCKAYALFDEGVGYAQGINFIAMPLLFNMSEAEAFALLVRLMSKYDVRGLFVGDMVGLHLRLYQFERLLEDFDPALYCHLKRRNVSPQLYATQWFLTMFAYRFPLQLVLRVYDLVFSEGLTAILKFGIVLMQRNRATLLEMKDMSALTNFLKEKVFDVYIDKSPSASSLLDSGFFGSVTGGADKELYRADEMVRDACEISIDDATLAAYAADFEVETRAANDSSHELEHLRTSNIALAARVKELEDRSQTQDAEHVQLAGEVVRVKVENDSMHDEVEGLRVRNEELQKVVDAQPAEVEEKLREEMERIMQRNSEVQNENRALKEEMDEMERVLVEAKMGHAQTQSDHDALKQRLASVQALLGDSK